MLGARIRQARVQAGLSQTQLAGGGLHRSYLSRIGAGKSRSSPVVLGLLAQRLGRPAEYFTRECDDEEGVREDIALAAQALADNDLPRAVDLASRATASSQQLVASDSPLRAQAAICLSRSLYRSRRFAAAVHHARLGLEWIGSDAEVISRASCLSVLANALYHDEQFEEARGFYEQLIQTGAGQKRLLQETAHAWTYLASCLYRLGRLYDARDAYRTGEGLCRHLGDAWGQVSAQMGVGWIEYRLGNVAAASVITQTALHASEHSAPDLRPKLLQNAAIFQRETGDFPAARRSLTACRQLLQAQGDARQQASLWEEFAELERCEGQMDAALTCLKTALQLLGQTDGDVLRGRLYR